MKKYLGEIEQLNICTEIVTVAETDLTESARRLQIPVLDPSWIIESIIQVVNQNCVTTKNERFQIFVFLYSVIQLQSCPE